MTGKGRRTARGQGREGGGEPDVEADLDRLHATPPSGFVALREELAAVARTEGRTEDARRLRAARRPPLAAWAANLLLRSRPEESRRFLELGQALREAHQDLDAAGIRELSAQRRRVVAALSRTAADLARDAGERLSPTVRGDLESTLLAVLADAGAAEQWATGRLEAALTPPSDFPSSAGSSAGPGSGARTESTARPTPARRRTARAASPAPDDTAGGDDQLGRRRKERQERLDRAREAAEEAARRRDEHRAEHDDAEAAARTAHDRKERAEDEVREAGQRLEEAREALRQAREVVREAAREERRAEERRRTTASALAEAEREARKAADAVERIERPRARR